MRATEHQVLIFNMLYFLSLNVNILWQLAFKMLNHSLKPPQSRNRLLRVKDSPKKLNLQLDKRDCVLYNQALWNVINSSLREKNKTINKQKKNTQN